MLSDGEADAFDLKGGSDVEGSEAERYIVLEEWSMILCVVQAVTGLSGVVVRRRFSVVV